MAVLFCCGSVWCVQDEEEDACEKSRSRKFTHPEKKPDTSFYRSVHFSDLWLEKLSAYSWETVWWIFDKIASSSGFPHCWPADRRKGGKYWQAPIGVVTFLSIFGIGCIWSLVKQDPAEPKATNWCLFWCIAAAPAFQTSYVRSGVLYYYAGFQSFLSYSPRLPSLDWLCPGWAISQKTQSTRTHSFPPPENIKAAQKSALSLPHHQKPLP